MLHNKNRYLPWRIFLGEGMQEITHFGGWREYKASANKKPRGCKPRLPVNNRL